MNEPESELQIVLAAAVMGRFPEYLELSRGHSINALAVPDRLWRVMVNTGEHWTLVSSFWRQIGKSRRSIVLASNPGLTSTSSLYGMELEFLGKLGYVADPTGARLDFAGGEVGKATDRTVPKSSWGRLQSLVRKLFPQSTFRAGMEGKLTPKGSDLELEEKVRKDLAFLFRDSAASIISNYCFPGAFGNVVLVLAAGALLLRVVQDRGEFRVDVAPGHAPTEWKLLALALSAVEANTQNPIPASCSSVQQAAALLAVSLESLRTAFSPTNYASTKSRMYDIETKELKAWISTFNSFPRPAH